MKAFLMRRDRDFDLERALPANEAVLAKDLALDTLFSIMAAKDPLVLEVARKAILASVFNDGAVIEYRQAALKDCLSNPAIVRELYGLTVEFCGAPEEDMVDIPGVPLRPARHFGPADGRFRRRAEAPAGGSGPAFRPI